LWIKYPACTGYLKGPGYFLPLSVLALVVYAPVIDPSSFSNETVFTPPTITSPAIPTGAPPRPLVKSSLEQLGTGSIVQPKVGSSYSQESAQHTFEVGASAPTTFCMPPVSIGGMHTTNANGGLGDDLQQPEDADINKATFLLSLETPPHSPVDEW